MKKHYKTPTSRTIGIAPLRMMAGSPNTLNSDGSELRFDKSSIKEGSIEDAV